jgi:hypothetical protein
MVKTYPELCRVSILVFLLDVLAQVLLTVSSRAKKFVDLHDQVQVRVLLPTSFVHMLTS